MTTPPVDGLPMKPGRNGGPVEVPCPTGRCNLPHDPRKCTGHKDLEDGTRQPCGRYPSAGLKVCRSHGAGAPQVKAAGEQRAEVERAERVLAKMGRPYRRVDNPLVELQQLLGEVLGWKDRVAEVVAGLDSFTIGENTQPRGEVLLLLQFIDRCDRIAANVGRLDIDRRLAEVKAAALAAYVTLLRQGLDAYNDVLELSAEQRGRVPAATAALAAVADSVHAAAIEERA